MKETNQVTSFNELFNDKKIPINSHSNSFYDLKDLYTSDIDELDKHKSIVEYRLS